MLSAILHSLFKRRSIQVVDDHEQLSHSDLIDLYKHYWSVLLAELGFCHQYLNFYSGLLSALLAATLAGLLSIKFGGLRELLLLLGPALIFVLAWNGSKTIETFYRRFAEAWVTIINLESMLHIRYAPQPIELGYQPLYIGNRIMCSRLKGKGSHHDGNERTPLCSVHHGVDIFRRFFEAIVEQCQQAGLVWGKELSIDATKVKANASLESLKPRFAVEARLVHLVCKYCTLI